MAHSPFGTFRPWHEDASISKPALVSCAHLRGVRLSPPASARLTASLDFLSKRRRVCIIKGRVSDRVDEKTKRLFLFFSHAGGNLAGFHVY